jgi:hypothetical protein
MADRIMEMVRRRHALGEVRDSAGVAGDDGDADNFCPLRPLYALAIDHLIVCVEQLDRATDELADGSAISGRLALILIDNVVELLMHRRCKDIFQREAGFDPDPAKPGRYSTAARVRVLGQRFDEKYKLLLREGDLSQQELDFIRICHDNRGEACHAGLTHDAFIRSLAAEYHALACSLIARLQVSWRTSSSIDQYGPRVEKHLRTGPGRLGDRYLCTPIEDMAVSLNASRSPLDIRLQDALADALSSRLDSIEASLQFLVDSTPDGGRSRERKPMLVLELRGELSGPVKKVSSFKLTVFAEAEPAVGAAEIPSVGSIISMRGSLDAVVQLAGFVQSRSLEPFHT